MTLMPEVHDVLARAVATRKGQRRRWHPSRRTGLLAVGAVIVSGTAVAASTGWPPALGSPHDPIRPAHTPVPGDQSAALGVLRRSQTDADRGSDVQATLRSVPGGGESHGVRLAGVRQLAAGPTPGHAVILVPQEGFGAGSTGPRIKDALCVLYPSGPREFGGRSQTSTAVSCWTTAEVLGGKAKGLAPAGNRWHLYGLVPDGVARVAITHYGGTSTQAVVHNNFFDIPAANGTEDPATDVRTANPKGPPRWLDAHGRQVKPQRERGSAP